MQEVSTHEDGFPMRIVTVCSITLLVAAFSLAQAQAQKETLEKQLEGEYKITTPTADNTDLVTTGSVLIRRSHGCTALWRVARR
jgi:hypothetical protein